ncbi:triosephosphate isomerase [Luteibacter sp. UNC138MFCol5.1]|uniref:triose-phosphate isomerase n=1 Tax=Luteibacter sp. UNC138MFCol5.1 TaxID=1502774 RepID=UPI0008CD9A52|nr:triose-phosphate isomerase [Luteibacter sp. UNC138MFCol5.1]SEO55382.1 triosephosphate isomerase [Luteibacter sp. UNC138MFCol5.1]
MRKMLVAGNWKMHGSRIVGSALVHEIARSVGERVKAGALACEDVVLFPPTTHLGEFAAKFHDSGLGFGAQDVSEHVGTGAYTGEVSGEMLRDVGARWVIVGHSERRQYHHESDELVARKFAAALKAGLTPIVCVGETKEEHEDGRAEEVIGRQLGAVLDLNGIEPFRDAVVAYEPVWAIGTGLTATPETAQKIHAFIRSQLGKKDANISLLTRVLYGGSVKPANAAELFAQPDVDGGLIGGAALLANDFLDICAAARR